MIYAVILAAGAGRRFGGPKALAVWEGLTFLQRAVSAAREAGLGTIVVANGATEIAAREAGVDVVATNPDVESGMLASIRIGVAAAAEAGASAVVLVPVDHPLVGPGDLSAVAAAAARGRIAVGEVAGRRGHPVGLPADLFAAALALAPERGDTMRTLLATRAESVETVPVSEGAFAHVNTRDDLAKLSRLDR